MSDNDKGVAVIGGAGFVGSRLASRFENSGIQYSIHDIYINECKNKNTVQMDVRDSLSLEKLEGHSVIVNLAAEHRDDIWPVSRYDDVNVDGAINICNAARKFDINKIIFTSSVAIYGFAPPNTDESGQPNYFNDYGRTKYLAEQEFQKWLAEDPNNRTLVIVRPTVIFGEANRGNMYNLLRQISSHKFAMLGNGKNIKSIAYVENVAAFLEYTLSFNPGLHIYNYIDKPDFDMNTLVSYVREVLFNKSNVGIRIPSFVAMSLGYLADFLNSVMKANLPVSSIRVKKFMSTTQFSSSIIKTGFIAPISIHDGLNKTLKYEFIDNNFDQVADKKE